MNSAGRAFGWDCRNGQNCFNTKKRLNFSVLNPLFPGNVCLTDIDGALDVFGHSFMLELKEKGAKIENGQRDHLIFHSKRTPMSLSIILESDNQFEYPEVMEFYLDGVWVPPKANVTRDELFGFIAGWVKLITPEIVRPFLRGAA